MTRRGHHEGSIYKRSDGRWTATITIGYEHGKRKRKSYYGETRRDVQEQLTAALRDVQQGLPIVGERQNVEQYLTQWLATVEPTIRSSTWQRYHDYVHLHLVPTLGRISLAKLTPQHIQQLYAAKLSEGYSRTTVAHLHAVVHRALDAALRLSLVQRNISELVYAPKIRRVEMSVLTPDQVRRFLEVAATDRLFALYVLAITTGMRQGELLALKWRDVDLDAGILQVRATLQHTPTGFTFGQPKTAHSRRKIELTTKAITALRQHRAQQLEERLMLGPAWEDHDLVFPNVIGGPLLKSNMLYRSFKPLLERAGLAAIRFHDLRHTAATLLLLQGVHAKIVSEMLGHASISITLDTYSHVLPSMQREAVRQMDMLLLSDSPMP